MRAFFDTSVLIPAMVDQLSNHARCFEPFRECHTGEHEGFCSTHVLAECYSVMTVLPLRRRISPADARELIRDTVAGTLTVVPLDDQDYIEAIDRISGKGMVSGIIYDALHLVAAERAVCDRIYTLNTDHFLRIGSDAVAITAP